MTLPAQPWSRGADRRATSGPASLVVERGDPPLQIVVEPAGGVERPIGCHRRVAPDGPDRVAHRAGAEHGDQDIAGPPELIRAAIAQLVITIGDIRTSKVDPNSTKRFCAGTLRIRFPSETLQDADKARDTAGATSVSDLADNADVERHADSFTTPIEFNVQPTDDGSKVFAETESGNNLFGFATELLSSALMRSAVENSQREARQAAEQQSAEQNAAVAEQRNANVASVRMENQLANQTIGAVWRAIPSDTRDRLVPVQRAWIRKKSADCAVEAASASTDATEREAARLACDTRATRERVDALGEFRHEEAPTAIAPPETSSPEPEEAD